MKTSSQTPPDQLNVFGEPLETCSTSPMTGYFRTGCCETGPQDLGSHTVCAIVNEEFLEYTKAQGNDLSTPQPPYFEGLRPGDSWCLCAARWLEAHRAGKAPPVNLRATHKKALEVIELSLLVEYQLH